MLILLPRDLRFTYKFEQNKPWVYEDLIAPFDFPVLKTPTVLKADQALAAFQLSPIYDYDSNAVQKAFETIENEIANEKLSLFSGAEIQAVESELEIILHEIYTKGLIGLEGNLNLNTEFVLIKNEYGKVKKVRLSDLYTFQKANSFAKKAFSQLIEEGKQSAVLKIFQNSLIENLKYDSTLTNIVLKHYVDRIPVYSGMIQKGELIITKGSIVNNEKLLVLKSLQKEFEASLVGPYQHLLILLGQLILTLLFTGVIYHLFKKFKPDIFDKTQSLTVILFSIYLTVLMAYFANSSLKVNIYIIPIVIIPIVLRVFFDSWVSITVLLFQIIFSSFFASETDEFIVITFIVGVLAILSLQNFRKRSQFYLTAGICFIGYLIVYLGFTLYKSGSINEFNSTNLFWFAINSLLILLSSPLIYGFEKLLGQVSEVSLLEISDTNSPLLRELSMKAPGTFQHSMQVANLAEAAAYKLNANTLLVRVGALYHDIGKMANPMYFIENQMNHINPHTDLNDEESAEIIINHVLDGIRMARKNRIPEIIIDFIRTHHGDQRVEFFYQSSLKNSPIEFIKENKFRYPGPRPFSKETAIVMMADSVEAASRSLKNVSEEALSNLVDTIIDYKINNKQFDNSGITFKDVNEIKILFKKMLGSIYHVRVEYPSSITLPIP